MLSFREWGHRRHTTWNHKCAYLLEAFANLVVLLPEGPESHGSTARRVIGNARQASQSLKPGTGRTSYDDTLTFSNGGPSKVIE